MDAAIEMRLRRAERRVEILEKLVDERSRELAIIEEQAKAVQSFLVRLNDVIPGALISVTPQGVITRVNFGVQELLGYEANDLFGEPLTMLWPSAEAALKGYLESETRIVRDEAEWIAKGGTPIPVHLSSAVQHDADGNVLSVVFVGLDLRERRRLEVELRHAHKLEALGQLAAGVAHEINTPMQFIGDNLHFVQESFEAILNYLQLIGDLDPVLRSAGLQAQAESLAQASINTDLDYVRSRMPKAIERALEGVDRVSHIVEAMKAFSHPQADMGPVDLNKNLRDTLVVARNEYKYIADMETDFGELPPVICNGGDLNQVFLNLIVNAAHAIESRVKGTHDKGMIRVSTRLEGKDVVVAISDDGCGIPPQIRDRVFDPFFTTKEVGKGTGQGLAISRAVVVDRHHGSLTFESDTGRGTTFYVRIPVVGRRYAEAA